MDGQSFPLEAHFVHQLDDPALVGGYHRLAVIGLLYELGECNTFLDYFWDAFPEQKGTAAYDGVALDFNEKLAAELAEGYYHWYGSLTTPPCTEGVSWNLAKVRMTVCQRQVDVLKAALGLLVQQSTMASEKEFVRAFGDRVMFHIAGTALMTLLLNGSTTGYFVRRFGMDSGTRESQKMFMRVCNRMYESQKKTVGA